MIFVCASGLFRENDDRDTSQTRMQTHGFQEKDEYDASDNVEEAKE
jgi:hypothetical protein